MLEGGCLCGAIRYRLETVRDAGFCHCQACRRGSGSAFSAWALGEASLVEGTPRRFRERSFCGDCGTPLWEDRSGARRVFIGTLDNAAAVAPRIHLAAHEQLPWLKTADLLHWTESLEPTAEKDRRVWRKPADPSVRRESPLHLRAVGKSTLRDVLLLDVKGHQRRMVAANAMSLAQLQHATPGSWGRAIHAGEVVIGYVQVEMMAEDLAGLPMNGEQFVWRFMIDERYQRLGFGRQALDLVAAAVHEQSQQKALWLSCVRGPGSPYEFYLRQGFQDTGKDDDGEVILKRDYR